MRRSVLVASLLAASASVAAAAPAAESGRTYISIGADALPTAFEVATADHATLAMVMANDDVAVLGIDSGELDHLTEAMHARHDRCGGFMVHDSLADALDAVGPAPQRAPLDYTIDHGDDVKTVLAAVQPDDILTTIRALSSRKNRYYRSESGAAVSVWLRDRWRRFAGARGDVTVDLFDQGYPQKSVILTIRGATKPDEVVVIGGHLDSIAVRGTASDAPGADDDASGIATLDHIAKILLAADYHPQRTLQF